MNAEERTERAFELAQCEGPTDELWTLIAEKNDLLRQALEALQALTPNVLLYKPLKADIRRNLEGSE